jgi:hypothetical protein
MKKKLICIKCGVDWKGAGSPATCPECKESSAAIVVEDEQIDLPDGRTAQTSHQGEKHLNE